MQSTISNLAEVIRNSSLEEHIQDNGKLIGCFIAGGYSYHPQKNIKVQTVIEFYKFITSLSTPKKKIVFDNIYNRLSTLPIRIKDEELPF